MRITMKAIAARCGVDVSTVSAILGGSPERQARYAPATRERVLAAAEKLGYRMNAHARGVRRGRHDAIGLLLGDYAISSVVDPSMLDGLEDELVPAGLVLQLGRVAAAEAVAGGTPPLLRQWTVDAVLVNVTHGAGAAFDDCLDRTGLPRLWLNNRRSSDCIHFDDAGGARAATERLLALGHRRIVWLDNWSDVAPPELGSHHSHTDRWRGYAEAMRAAGRVARRIPPAPADERPTQLRALLSAADRPTAALVYAPPDLALLVHTAALIGLTVPRDLALVGFHEYPQTVLGIVLAAAVLPVREMGRAAVNALVARIGAPPKSQPPIVLPVGFAAGSGLFPPPA